MVTSYIHINRGEAVFLNEVKCRDMDATTFYFSDLELDHRVYFDRKFAGSSMNKTTMGEDVGSVYSFKKEKGFYPDAPAIRILLGL